MTDRTDAVAQAVVAARDAIQARVIHCVLAERDRQDDLWGADHNRSQPTGKYLWWLIEELGETAQEWEHWRLTEGKPEKVQQRLTEEMTQVAALAVAALEAIDVSGPGNRYPGSRS